MGQRYLLDTNILIYYFKGQIPSDIILKFKEIISNEPNISIITRIEFLGWPEYDDISYEKSNKYISLSNIIMLSNEIADISIDIKKNYNLKLGDAIIAATALENELTLVTRNTKDFKKVADLKLYNPFEIE